MPREDVVRNLTEDEMLKTGYVRVLLLVYRRLLLTRWVLALALAAS